MKVVKKELVHDDEVKIYAKLDSIPYFKILFVSVTCSNWFTKKVILLKI